MLANAHGPVLTNPFDVKRRMPRICDEQAIVLARELLNFDG